MPAQPLKHAGQAFMLAAAAGCLLAAAVANPLVMTRFLRLSALPPSLAGLLWLIDAALIVLAGLFVYRRADARVQLKAALLTGSLLFTFVFSEAILRLMDVRPASLALFREDPGGHGSFRLKPNLDVTTTVGGQPIALRTNAHGMRWPEVPVVSTGARRIAFVGDSFTFGLWADSDMHSFVGVADTMLRPYGVESLNFGVPGYGLADVELLARDEVLRFKPAYLVLAFYNGNDFLDTYLGVRRYHVSRSGILDTDWDYLDTKIPAEFKPRGQTAPVIARLFVYGLVRNAATRMWPRAVEASDRFVDPAKVDRSYQSNMFWSQTEYPPFARSARDMTLAALGRIADLSSGAGMRLVIVTIPSVEQVLAPAAFGAGYDIGLPQRSVAEFAKVRHIDYLDLLPALAASNSQGVEPYLRYEGHFTNEGHRIAGEAIAEFLRSLPPRGDDNRAHD
jgi:lysophospholipase L1-like esterase